MAILSFVDGSTEPEPKEKAMSLGNAPQWVRSKVCDMHLADAFGSQPLWQVYERGTFDSALGEVFVPSSDGKSGWRFRVKEGV